MIMIITRASLVFSPINAFPFIGVDKKQQHCIIYKIINLAIRATYFIFCRRNKICDRPDLVKL